MVLSTTERSVDMARQASRSARATPSGSLTLDQGPVSTLGPVSERFRIGQLAVRCGISRDTIRFYEREGLLPRPRRTASRHRLYDLKAVEHVRFIRRAQELGLTLDDIGRLRAVGKPDAPGACQKAQDILRIRLEAIEERLGTLEDHRRELTGRIAQCDGNGTRPCPLLLELTGAQPSD